MSGRLRWTAAILAGGQARRFGGRDKSGLVVGGWSILERQLEVLAAVTDDVIVVGGAPAGAEGRVRVVPDREPGRGPLGGLHTALLESPGAGTLLVACDMPYLSAPLLNHLITCAAAADAVVPRTGRGYHPLCALYTRACLAPAARRLGEGRLAMVDLLEDVRVRVVTPGELDRFGDPDRLLANVNTPEDYQHIEAFQGHQLSS